MPHPPHNPRRPCVDYISHPHDVPDRHPLIQTYCVHESVLIHDTVDPRRLERILRHGPTHTVCTVTVPEQRVRHVVQSQLLLVEIVVQELLLPLLPRLTWLHGCARRLDNPPHRLCVRAGARIVGRRLVERFGNLLLPREVLFRSANHRAWCARTSPADP